MTHAELCVRAARWLKTKMNCGVVATEVKSYARETPDAIGYRHEGSIIIECKTSRSDFKTDSRKPWRTDPAIGMGMLRYYLCRPDIIRANELPENGVCGEELGGIHLILCADTTPIIGRFCTERQVVSRLGFSYNPVSIL